MSKKNKIKITQTRSPIGYRVQSRSTLEALGLKKMNHSVIHNDVPSIRGMIKAVHHLVVVEEL